MRSGQLLKSGRESIVGQALRLPTADLNWKARIGWQAERLPYNVLFESPETNSACGRNAIPLLAGISVVFE
jgi:hypothetical protein